MANQIEGLFEILEQVGYSFRLKLPGSSKVHLVFYVEKLRKDPNNPLLGQANPNPPPLPIQDGQEDYEYEV